LEALKLLNSLLSFFLELAMLAAFGYWGFHGEKSIWLKWVLGIGIPLAAILLWGFLLAPKSEHRLNMIAGVILSSILFLLASAALYQTGLTTLAMVMAVVVILNRGFILLWKQW
jgi:hypothetical protein